MNIGTAGSGSVTTIGNANGASGVKLNWGTGNFILTPLIGTAGALVLSNAGVVSEASGTSGLCSYQHRRNNSANISGARCKFYFYNW